MLKKRMLGIGIAGIGVLCMLMNATGNVIFFSPAYDLTGWGISKDAGATIDTPEWTGHSGQYSLYLSSPWSGNHKCYVTSPTMVGFSGTSRYFVSFAFYLPSTTISGFYLFYNGQINLVQYGSTLLSYGSGGWSQNVVFGMTTGQHDIIIDVNAPGCPSGYNYIIYYDGDFNSPIYAKFYNSAADTKVKMGDTELGSTCYGSMYYDQMRIWHLGTYVANLKNYDLLEEFTAGHLDATTNPWTVYKDDGSAVSCSNAWNYDFYADARSLHINCPRSNKAWATTPSNPAFNKYNDYMISMWIKLPTTTTNNFFIVVANQEVFIVVSHNNVLHWCTSTTNGHLFTMEYNTWYLLKCIVSPSSHKYNVYIGNTKVNTNPIDTYFTDGYYAWNYLGMGIDTANYYNYGELYWDDIRVNQP